MAKSYPVNSATESTTSLGNNQLMQKIIPHLWFDKEPLEAARFYESVFPDSKINSVVTLHNTPSGDTDIVSFELMGYAFMAINGGPLFKFNPSISFMINFDPSKDSEAVGRIDAIWNKLIEGGSVLMPLEKYPFSDRYGWVQDKYGVSWQLILTDANGQPRPSIIPAFLFVGDVYGQVKSATDFYLSVFKNSDRGTVALYPPGMEPDKEGNVMFSDFRLENQWFSAMESAQEHNFSFNEAISLIVQCDNQAEIDYYWGKLSAVPEAEQCGWLKDKYGVSWQVSPTDLDQMLSNGTPEQVDRLTQAFLPMKKIDLAKLKKVFGSGK